MSFISIYFLMFLAILFPTYFLCSKNYRWITLLIASIVFYLLCGWQFIFFIIFATLCIYFASMYITKNKSKENQYFIDNQDLSIEQKKLIKNKNKKKRKLILILGIISVVAVLAIMKYLNFLIGNLNWFIGLFDRNLSIGMVNWILPLGISFYTFQAIGYLVDVYWGKYNAEHNIFKFFLFMIFFPKIIQGPIIRYNEISESLFSGNDFDYNNFVSGLKRMIWGFFKKIVIADTLVVFTSTSFSSIESISGIETLLTIFCYFIYDYCDFSGYMDIACGVSRCLGIKLPENFNHPYFAKGIDEYWRRWHITLGAWFKDYIFYPLSISKFSLKLGKKSKKLFGKNANKVPAILGLIIVWFLTGLWHGASWNYVLWGLYFGFIIILNIITEPIFNKMYDKLKINKNALWLNIFRHIRTLILLAIGKIIFETNSIGAAIQFIGNIFNGYHFWFIMNVQRCVGWPSLIIALICSVAVLIVDLIQEYKPQTTFIEKMDKWHILLQWACFLALIIIIIWFGYYGDGLPKFEFGYMRF